MEEILIHCQNCNSTNIEAKEKGFDSESAAVGGLLLCGLGMLFAGYKNRKMVIIHCLDCKHQSNHNQVLGTDHKTFKAEFYKLYQQAKYDQAIASYFSYLDTSEENTETIHQLYARFRSEDRRSLLITIFFVISMVLLLTLLMTMNL
jgi:hypothetical protein